MVTSTITQVPDLREDRASKRLILVSNRGPVEHYLDHLGQITRRPAAGGVAVALASVARMQPVTWLAGACSVPDRVAASSGQRLPLGNDSEVKLVDLPDETHEAFYHRFCNPLLWFVQHSLANELDGSTVQNDATESWRTGYFPVNRLFAESAVEEIDRIGGRGRVMLHDYHLYLAPRLIRRLRPHAVLQQFVHVPWPRPRAWLALLDALVRQICDGLLANDSVSFQTEDCAENFVGTCRAYLGEGVSVGSRGDVAYLERSTSVWSNPISVDSTELQEIMASQQVRRYKQALDSSTARTIVRVDRLDPSKNIVRGFEAYELLLDRRPDLLGSVRFLAFLVPSRNGIAEYDSYEREAFELVERINSRYGRSDWQPITVFHEHNREQALAALGSYDVLLVNSVADGMNLVSKEGPMVNENDGVLVLSCNAGSFQQLREAVLVVDPLDIPGTAGALEAGLSMRSEERRRRSCMLRSAISSHQLADWLRALLKDLNR